MARTASTSTWITGVVAFLASVVECFTGYLSQQNFDSQWIATNGKDAFNAAGIGAFFNLMNFGQMLLWHVVLIPIILVALIGAHVLLVRVRGVSHPLPARTTWRRSRSDRIAQRAADAAPWRGPTRRYDILKEGAIASLVALVVTVGLAAVLSSPDAPPVTVRSWVQVAPADFLATAASELNGTSLTATYGPPYNTNGTPQSELFSPANWPGVTQPIDAAQTFVLEPLSMTAPTDPQLKAALATYNAASSALQNKWATNYGNAVTKVTFVGGTPVVPAANDGPVPVMLATELTLARSGAIDAALSAQQPFYGTDFTKPLLFLEDGQYYANQATAMHLTGDQWGVMNETGNYPGQPWLWLYQLWYHVPGAGVHLAQRRPDRHLHDRRGHAAPAVRPVHPWTSRHPAPDPGAPPDLAHPARPACTAGWKPANAAARRPPGSAGAGMTAVAGPGTKDPRSARQRCAGSAAAASGRSSARGTSHHDSVRDNFTAKRAGQPAGSSLSELVAGEFPSRAVIWTASARISGWACRARGEEEFPGRGAHGPRPVPDGD